MSRRRRDSTSEGMGVVRIKPLGVGGGGGEKSAFNNLTTTTMLQTLLLVAIFSITANARQCTCGDYCTLALRMSVGLGFPASILHR